MKKQTSRIVAAQENPIPEVERSQLPGLSLVHEVRHLNVDEVLKRSLPKASQTPIETKKKKEVGSELPELSSSAKSMLSIKPVDRSKKRSAARLLAFFFR
jgi:hypothetical protein